MKKQIVLLSILLSAAILSMSQEQCVSCFENTISIENYSSALGTYNSSLGLSSLATGDSNTVSGNYAIALGKRNTASGIASFAMGLQNSAIGDHSFAGGYNSISSGIFSFSFGNQAEALGNYSFAFGPSTMAQHTGSVSLGSSIQSLAYQTMIFGHGLLNQPLVANIDNSIIFGNLSDIPTLFISGSNGAGTTGKIGIGNVTDPDAKLHIKSDNNEHASILLDPTGSYYGKLMFGSGTTNHYIQARSGSNMQFKTENNQDFVFENGNVGVGTNSPDAKFQVSDGDIFIEDIDRGIIMKSPDGNCWRGTLNNTGMLEFVQVDCDDLSTGTADHSTSRDAQVRIYPNPAGNQISVNLPQDYVGASLEIVDISGKLFRTHPLTSTECNINISELSPGMYVFNIMDDAGKVLESKKIVKE